MQCLQCKNEFEAERSTARFCGASCRSLYRYRAKDSVQTVSVQKPVTGDDFVADVPQEKTNEEILKDRPYLKGWIERGLNPNCQNAFSCFANGICSC